MNQQQVIKVYNTVTMDLHLQNGIFATDKKELTFKEWEILISSAKGNREIAEVCVDGYFDGNGSKYLKELLNKKQKL